MRAPLALAALSPSLSGRLTALSVFDLGLTTLLVKAVANPHVQCGWRASPLRFACLKGNLGMVHSLVKAGEEVNRIAEADSDTKSIAETPRDRVRKQRRTSPLGCFLLSNQAKTYTELSNELRPGAELTQGD